MKTQKLPKIGAAFEGGFFAGRFFIGDQPYGLIVAPKAEGETAGAWNKSTKNVSGATSYCDGLANTKAMAKAGSELAKRMLSLQIGGFDDWYLPSRLELLLAYHELKASKVFSVGAKQAFESLWYWSSTQHAENAGYAWRQLFGYGSQFSHHKANEFRARAVRRIKL
jgi:hypothetical protein